MTATDITICLAPPDSRILAYATAVFDGVFVVHGIRIVQNREGRYIVQMPDRDRIFHCSHCHRDVPMANRFCGSCGQHLGPGRQPGELMSQYVRDVAHPVTTDFRAYLDRTILAAYRIEMGRVNPPPLPIPPSPPIIEPLMRGQS